MSYVVVDLCGRCEGYSIARYLFDYDGVENGWKQVTGT